MNLYKMKLGHTMVGQEKYPAPEFEAHICDFCGREIDKREWDHKGFSTYFVKGIELDESRHQVFEWILNPHKVDIRRLMEVHSCFAYCANPISRKFCDPSMAREWIRDLGQHGTIYHLASSLADCMLVSRLKILAALLDEERYTVDELQLASSE